MIKIWDDDAWEDYIYWQTQDKKVLKRINILIKDIDRNGHEGIGKPEEQFALLNAEHIMEINDCMKTK